MAINRFRADVLDVRDDLRKAEYALELRRYDLAIELLQQMLKEHPENSAVFYTLARAYLGKQWPTDAQRAVCEALRLDPHASQAHTLYGNVLSNLNRMEEAEAEYRVSLTLRPEVAYTHYMYATFLLDKCKKVAQAREHASKALELDPAAAIHHVVMAKILALEGKLAEADGEFKRALSLDPENFLVRRVYGWYLLYKRNDPAQAYEQLRQALRLNPNDVNTRKIFTISLKARQKSYRPVWNISLYLYNSRLKVTRSDKMPDPKKRRIRGWEIFSLLLALSLVMVAFWGTDPLYQIVTWTLAALFCAGGAYIVICNIVLNRMIKQGRLK